MVWIEGERLNVAQLTQRGKLSSVDLPVDKSLKCVVAGMRCRRPTVRVVTSVRSNDVSHFSELNQHPQITAETLVGTKITSETALQYAAGFIETELQ